MMDEGVEVRGQAQAFSRKMLTKYGIPRLSFALQDRPLIHWNSEGDHYELIGPTPLGDLSSAAVRIGFTQ